MSKVVVDLSISLDGFIAGANDGPENSLGDGGDALFAWYFSGDIEVPMPVYPLTFRTDPASAQVLRETFSRAGADIHGRRTFDIAKAWGGKDPNGVPSFVVSHDIPNEWSAPDSAFTFVTDGIASAVEKAKAAANGKDIGVAGASIVQQCLAHGLLDEIHLHVAPVLLGSGVRLFDQTAAPVTLEKLWVVDAPNVTHYAYRVVK